MPVTVPVVNIPGNAATADEADNALACSGNAASATTAGACTGNAASATTAAACTGNAATATTAAACSGTAVFATYGINAIGYNQTWQNMTASRALATNYTNTTGRPIAVSVCVSSNSQQNITFTVDGLAMPQGGGSAVGEAMLGFVIVPPVAVYRVDCGGASGIVGQGWNELR